jgi:hypothetical protein
MQLLRQMSFRTVLETEGKEQAARMGNWASRQRLQCKFYFSLSEDHAALSSPSTQCSQEEKQQVELL